MKFSSPPTRRLPKVDERVVEITGFNNRIATALSVVQLLSPKFASPDVPTLECEYQAYKAALDCLRLFHVGESTPERIGAQVL